jgi:predicted PurR-regulated permease PerM
MLKRPSERPTESARPAAGRQRAQQAATFALYAGLVLLALWVIRDFIPAVGWAAVIAIALWPVLRKIEKARLLRGRTTLVAALMTVAIAVLIVLPVALGIGQATHEVHDVFDWVHAVQQNGIAMPDFVHRLPFGAQQIADWWQANLAQPLRQSPAIKGLHGGAVMSFGRQFGLRAVHGLMVFGFMLVTLFVIFQAGPRLSGDLLTGAQRAFGTGGAQLIERMAAAVRGTVAGLVVVGIGEGALLGIAYAVAGVPHATLLAFVTAIAAMLPFCAPLVFCGAGLWLLVEHTAAAAIGLVVFGFVVVFVAEHFVRPVIIGSSTRLPFLLVLFGILGGAETFGLLGLFIGPALMTVLMVLWTDWVRR